MGGDQDLRLQVVVICEQGRPNSRNLGVGQLKQDELEVEFRMSMCGNTNGLQLEI